MVREKVKAKKTRHSPKQYFSLEEESTNAEQELMELYDEEQTKESTAETLSSQNTESLETMLEAEDISDATAEFEEYSQKYDQDEELVQCVPELVVYTPVQSETKPQDTKERRGPRRKSTPKRRRQEKAVRHKIKPPKISTSVAPQTLHPGSECDDQDEFPKAKKEGTWIQCSKADCLKWRKLPNEIEPSSMPDRWVCAMNPDISRIECTASQETCNSEVDFDVVYTPFVAGSLVWAKVPGYPWWPGMVEDDPDYNCCYETDETNVNPISYHVSFIFDKEVSRSWVSYLGIRNFSATENPNENGPKQKKYAKSLARANAQATNAVDLTLAERVKKYSFSVLYKGEIGSEMDVKTRKVKKRKPKTSPKLGNPKKTKTTKPENKSKRPSFTDSEKSVESSQSVGKRKVKNRKRVLQSSDEEESGKEIATDGGTLAVPTDASVTQTETSRDDQEQATHKKGITSQIQPDDSDVTINNDHSSPQRSKNNESDTREDAAKEKTKAKNTKKKAKIKNEASKKKRTSTSSEEERTKVPRKNTSPNQLKLKKRKPKKSEEKPTTTCKATKTKKKAKFVTPIEAKSTSTFSNKSNVSEDSLDKDTEDGSTIREIHVKKLSLDTSTDSSIDEWTPDIDNSKHSQSTDEEIATAKDPKESSGKKKPTALKPKKNKTDKVGKDDDNLSKDSTKNKVSVVKPKKFEMTLAVSKKSKATSEKKMKTFKKKSSTVISGKENGGASLPECASASDIVLEGSSVKPNDTKTSKTLVGEKRNKTSKVKMVKQAFSKFKAPVKASSKVTPVTKLQSNIDEKSKKAAKKTLEEALDIPSSDDPRKNPEKYVSIDSLEKDISNLYHELSENVAASTGAINAEDLDDVNEASDCVTMEFLDQQISGNAGNSKNISARRLTDSPEF